MGGYMTVISACVACGKMLAANPNWCPSIRVKGKREPICRSCFNDWNQIHRIDKGLDPVELHPQAYGWVNENDAEVD
jgi:hypothetical protein